MSIEKSQSKPQNFADEAFDAQSGEDAKAISAPETKAAAGPAKAAQAAPKANGDTRKP